jgi:hypothetical protein
MVGGREMWWVLASGGQLDGVVNSMGDYVTLLLAHDVPEIITSFKSYLLTSVVFILLSRVDLYVSLKQHMVCALLLSSRKALALLATPHFACLAVYYTPSLVES